MSLSNLFEKIAGKQHLRRRQRMAGYREFVAGIAAGQEPDADEVERILADAGKSLDDLRKDVDLDQHRVALKAQVAAIPELEAKRHALDEQIVVADQVLEAAEKQHEETTAPLYAMRQQIQQALSDASRARMELINSCSDGDMQREMAELDTEAARLYQELRKQIDRATYMDEKSRSERQRAEREISQGDIDSRREVGDRYQADAETARREVKKLEKASSEIEKRRERLEEQMRQV
jgi:chromosome segregation ATPase